VEERKSQVAAGRCSKAIGELDAIDVNTGRILWSSPLKAPDFGGATVSRDLIFTSTFTGTVLTLNRSSGKQVWSWQTSVDINSPLTVGANEAPVR
jgi:alcohol dehydrogenase (cytochrome c)